MVRQADDARTKTRRDQGVVRLAYLSGTPTHDHDFLEAADALLWALERHANVRLVVVGFLALDSSFEKYEARIERVPYQPWQRLPSLLAAIDVNLAPLERGNAF